MDHYLKRLLKLAGLTHLNESEMLDYSPDISKRIDDVLAAYDPEMRDMMMDAVDLLKINNGDSVTIKNWATKFKEIYPDQPAGPVLQTVAHELPFVVKRTGPSLYAYVEDDIDMPADERNAIEQHVGNTYDILKIMKRLKEFTANTLITTISQQLNMSPDMAAMQASIAMQHFSAMVEKLPNGVYKFIEEKKVDTMDLLRDVARRASLQKGDED